MTDARGVRAVRHHEHRRVQFGGKFREQVQNVFAVHRVEIARRFVGEQQSGFVCERTGVPTLLVKARPCPGMPAMRCGPSACALSYLTYYTPSREGDWAPAGHGR